MRALHSLIAAVGIALCGATAFADVVEPTLYDYDHVPPPGKEAGTYAFNSSGSIGADCVYALSGMAKLLPNAEGTGGTVCAKGFLDVRGTGPLCPVVSAQATTPVVVTGPYTYNGDGTTCENLHIVGGAFDGRPINFHTYVDPKGKWILPTAQNIAYPCPGIVPNDQVIGSATALKVGKHGDDPPGSGVLPCTNP